MRFVDVIETSHEARARRRTYLIALMLVFAAVAAATAARLSGWLGVIGPMKLIDYHDFHLVGAMIARSDLDRAYAFADLAERQRALFGLTSFMPWTYPPQFDLIVAPLAHLPIGLGYALFTPGTFALYLLTLRRLAPEAYLSVVILLAPAFVVVLICGQNGFLTGALIGAAAQGFANRRHSAGAPLGLMAIKPHLAIAFALYALMSRRWGAAAQALAVVAGTSALATAAFGLGVWPAFLHAVREASAFLVQGDYPLARMVSAYAFVRSLGLPAAVATAAQLVSAGAAIAAMAIATQRFSERQAIGVAAIASLMLSPYAYDYDLPVLGVGVAMLLPDLLRYGSRAERATLYASALGVQLSAFLLAAFGGLVESHGRTLSLGCFCAAATLAVFWRVLERSRGAAPAARATSRSRLARLDLWTARPSAWHASRPFAMTWREPWTIRLPSARRRGAW